MIFQKGTEFEEMLEIPPQERDSDIVRVGVFYCKKMVDICFRMDFFNQLQDFIEEKEKRKSTLTQICKSVKLETYRKGDFVFRENDTDCNKAYVIVKGEVAIVKQFPKNDVTVTVTQPETLGAESNKLELKFPAPSPRNLNKISGFIGNRVSSPIQSPRKMRELVVTPVSATLANQKTMSPSDNQLSPQAQSPLLENSQKAEMYKNMDIEVKKIVLNHGNLIVRLRYGQIFGQYALQNNDPRSASVVATEDLSLMVIHKNEFNIIKEYYSTEFIQRQQFLSSILPRLDSTKDIKVHTKFIRAFEVVTFQKVAFCNLGSKCYSGRKTRIYDLFLERRRMLCTKKHSIH